MIETLPDGTIISYLTLKMEPTSKTAAEMVKVHLPDGMIKFGFPQRNGLEEAARDPATIVRDKWGKFAPTPGGPAGAPSVSISKGDERAYTGQRRNVRTKVSKQKAGKIGEYAAIEYLKSLGSKDATLVNTKVSNYPIDAVHDHEALEIKTGNVANTERAQQWRLTIGEPSNKEQAMLKNMAAEDKAIWNTDKSGDIVARKAKAMRDIEKESGVKLKARTLTMILDPDRRTMDIYSFKGFHKRIGWNSAEAKSAFVKTIKVDWAFPKKK